MCVSIRVVIRPACHWGQHRPTSSHIRQWASMDNADLANICLSDERLPSKPLPKSLTPCAFKMSRLGGLRNVLTQLPFTLNSFTRTMSTGPTRLHILESKTKPSRHCLHMDAPVFDHDRDLDLRREQYSWDRHYPLLYPQGLVQYIQYS